MDPLVSVIVGAYNHQRFIDECLDSLVSGTYPNIELIIFNDASTDDTDARIRAWIGRHPGLTVHYTNHAVNLGLTRSLNEAIDRAGGEFCCLIAADDVMLPSGIAARVEYLQRHPDKLAVFADAHVIDENGLLTAESALEGSPDPNRRMLKQLLLIDALMPYNVVFHFHVPGPVFMCRRVCYEIIGKYDECLGSEDFDMYFRLAAGRHVGYLNEVVACYRTVSTSMSQSQPTKLIKYLSEASQKNLRRYGSLCRLRLYSHIFYYKQLMATTRTHRVLFFIAHNVTPGRVLADLPN